jgi:hypothetical protein
MTADHTFTFSVSNNDNDSEFQRENIMSKSVTIISSSGFCAMKTIGVTAFLLGQWGYEKQIKPCH